MWHRADRILRMLFSGASPRAVILASPQIPWRWSSDKEYLVHRWVADVSAVPCTEEISQSVVDMVFQITSHMPSRYIAGNIWAWLTKRPSLPPVCLGRDVGACDEVVRAVRALKDVKILKSYLLLIWSEWNSLPHDPCNSNPPYACPYAFCGFCRTRILIQEDFGGVGMGHHRADLIHRLDYVLAQLGRGLRYLKQHNPNTDAGDLQRRKDQYRILREILLETNVKAISRTPHFMIVPFCVLTPIPNTRRIPHNIYVCTASSVSVVS